MKIEYKTIIESDGLERGELIRDEFNHPIHSFCCSEMKTCFERYDADFAVEFDEHDKCLVLDCVESESDPLPIKFCLWCGERIECSETEKYKYVLKKIR